MWKRKQRRDMADVHIYTAERLHEMAQSLEGLSRACNDRMQEEKGLTREDAQAAMQTAAAVVCGQCSRCNLYSDAKKEDSYYLYYLLRSFEQKGRVEYEDMPRLFLETCRNKEEYLAQLNRNLGRATMNLEWKNRFLESRDTVMVQFRELAMMLEEFASQMGQAVDITDQKQDAVRRLFHLHQISVDNMLLLQHENRYREAYVTLHALGNRCMTAKDAAGLFGQAVGGKGWYAPPDTRALITKQPGIVRFLEPGEYRMMYGVARMSKNGTGVSGDNYTYSGSLPGQVIMSISDGMGSGETAARESRKVIELVQQLLETGFSARSALKMVNTILMLTGIEQHPATLDLCCIDLCSGVLEAMKMGAVATFILSDGTADVLEAGNLPAGVLSQAEPVLLSRKLWDDDRVIMMSDGVLEACPGLEKEAALKAYLEAMPVKTPQDMAERILRFACQNGGMNDDMTVLVGGIWKR
ncbi:SpoIIE family protein phosphatase [Clostridium sp. OM02-18AC]|uniref:SpoIIE family protein phosphatase n=1 Tax=Clostridium sp. OM02-18AC TaxID=2292311 RepID=UPI00242D8F99|nr:SpoIIE family protein phosphatase [Clostridium sp. OM02-18AC]